MNKTTYNTVTFFHIILLILGAISYHYAAVMIAVAIGIVLIFLHLFFTLDCFDKKALDESIWFLYIFIPFSAIISLRKKINNVQLGDKQITVTETKESFNIQVEGVDDFLVIVKTGDPESDSVLLQALKKAVTKNMI